MGEKEELVSSPRPSDVQSSHHQIEGHRRQTTAWSDAHVIRSPTTPEHCESFAGAYGQGTKLDTTGMAMGELARGTGLTDGTSWNNFSPRVAHPSLHGLQPNFSVGGVSTSPETSESPTPPSLQGSVSDPLHDTLPGSFQRALHGTSEDMRTLHTPNLDDPDAIFRPFGTSRSDEFWAKGLDEFGNGSKSGSLQLPYPAPGLGNNVHSVPNSALSSLATANTLPLSRTTYPYIQHASYPDLFPHNVAFTGSVQQTALYGPGQLSPPPTASTSSTSSGSSSPFMRSDAFDHTTHNDGFERQGAWKHYNPSAGAYPSPPLHSDRFSYTTSSHGAQDWQAATCDPRGITGDRERDDPRNTGANYGDSITSNPSHSPALSDLSAASLGEQRDISGRGGRRLGHLDSGAGSYHGVAAPPPKGLMGDAVARAPAYKMKKKPGPVGEEMLGMGLEDVDERALEFTSRQDTKPTRMLRRQCFNCRTWRDVSAWRRSIMQVGHIVCNKCGLYEKAHKKSRPLNDRGEFVRPGKHAAKAPATAAGRARARARTLPDSGPVVGTGVMRFESNDSAT